MEKIIKRTISALSLSAFISTSLIAQDIKIQGVVVDSLTHEGEPFATIRVYKAHDDKEPVAMGTTDLEGRFEQAVKRTGDYRVLFTSVGRKNVNIPFSIQKGQTSLSLDTIYVTDDVTRLSGVEIVAQKPLVKMEVDKLSYSVENDIDAKSNSVLDMLRKVPMVTVDGNDNITVNGSSSFKVYVDGKPNVMMSSNPSEIFKNMPASSIKDIEVVTNPGARYDAEGVGGVLNLITDRTSESRKQLLNNYSATIRGMAANRGAGGGAFFSMQKNKFSMSINANVMESFPMESETEVNRTQFTSEGESQLRSSSVMDNSFHIQMGNLNLSYEIDSLNLLSASAGVMGFGMDIDGQSRTDLGGLAYTTRNDNKSKRLSVNGSVDYQHTFASNKERMLTLSYLITTAPQRTNNYSWFETDQTNSFLDLTDRYSHAKDNTIEHTWQADFSTPIAAGHKLDLGAKYILRDNTSRSDYYDLMGQEQLWDESSSLDYSHKNRILAGYAEYRGNIQRLSLTAGLRYEHTWQNVVARLGQTDNFKLNYGNLVPSANLSYKINDSQNIGAAYNLRISRPGITLLNPYVNKSDPTSISYGNTNLDAEEVHNISLVYNLFNPKWVVNLTLRQSICDNGIEQYSFYEGNVLNSTYGNITRNKQTGLNAFVNWNATGKTRFTLNGSVAYVDVRSEQLDLKNHGWQGNIMFGYQQTLPWDIRMSANIMASTKSYNLQGWNSGFQAGMLSLSKSFLKDKLNVTLTGMSPLNFGRLKFEGESAGHDYVSHTVSRISMANFGVSVSYTFGGKVNVKKTATTIQNSDLKNQRQEAEGIGTMIFH